MEAFMRFNVNTGSMCVVSQCAGTPAWALYMHINSLYFRCWDTGGTQRDGTAFTWHAGTTPPLNLNTWYHVACDRDGSGNLRVYIDGAMVSKTTGYTHNIRSGTGTADVGSVAGTNQYDFNGWMDEVRITKGVARYASDSGYTVPTAAFPRA
jgi:hypothetical protein